MEHTFTYNNVFVLENGSRITPVDIAYSTYGTINAQETMLFGCAMHLRLTVKYLIGGKDFSAKMIFLIQRTILSFAQIILAPVTEPLAL